jgi:hypothetical protein
MSRDKFKSAIQDKFEPGQLVVLTWFSDAQNLRSIIGLAISGRSRAELRKMSEFIRQCEMH